MHDLTERARWGANIAVAVFGSLAAITLNQVAVVLTIIAAASSAACSGVKLYDRFRHGRPIGGE